ncbi:MAG TPA: APC family permease [Ktedonobacterales bacterium]|nr:APC family permease [Ktedonobacterales bacterium]
MATTQTLRKHLTVTDGFILYISAVLGQSLIVLPSIAARHAGPWSVLIWAGLAAVSYPLARIMAELGARYPSAGGAITFIGQGLGQSAGWLTGALYLAAIVVGGPAGALIFSEYLGVLIPLPGHWPFVAAAGMMAALITGACLDVSRVMRFQRWGFLICLAAVTITLLLSLPHVSAARLTDVSGYDLAGVGSTGLICFFAFVGWENAAFSGEEFSDPRTLVKALGLAVIAVGALFVLLGVTVAGGLDRAVIATSDASLADLASLSLGAAGTRVAAVIAVALLAFFALTWTRSAARLIFALAREGLFPRPLARVHAASDAPRNAALALGAAWGLALLVQFLLGISIEAYIQLSSGAFLFTYVLIMLAAWRLLEIRRYLPTLVISTLAILALVVAGVQSLWYALAAAILFATVLAIRRALIRLRPHADNATPEAAGEAPPEPESVTI